MSSFTEQAFSRNLGFFSEQEQERLLNSTVAIAGAGGDGGELAQQIARLGVGEIRLADPDPFEVENINRQAFCTVDTVGVNKATAVGEGISRINTDMKVVTYTEGITYENVEEFVEGVDLVIDETEFTMHVLGAMLARAARKRQIPNLMAMNIGFGATVTAFHPNGKTFEEMLGLEPTASLEEIKNAEPSLSRWLPYLPAYGDIDVFKKVASGEKSAPSIAPGVAVAAGIGATQAFLHLAGEGNNRKKPVYAPRSIMVDAYTGQGKLIKHPIVSHWGSLAVMAANNVLGRNPKTSY